MLVIIQFLSSLIFLRECLKFVMRTDLWSAVWSIVKVCKCMSQAAEVISRKLSVSHTDSCCSEGEERLIFPECSVACLNIMPLLLNLDWQSSCEHHYQVNVLHTHFSIISLCYYLLFCLCFLSQQSPPSQSSIEGKRMSVPHPCL